MSGGDRKVISEEEARRLWERAAELQAEAQRREEASAAAADPGEDPEEEGSGYSLVHVRQAALEAGIQSEFVELALAEESLLEKEGGAEEKRIDRAARRFLDPPMETLEIVRHIPFSSTRVWPALDRILTDPPYNVDVLEVRGGDPRSGGVVLLEVTHSYQNLESLQYAAALAEVRRFLLRVRPDPDGGGCTVLIRAPLRRSRRVNYVVGVILASFGGALGGLVGLGAAALLIGGAEIAAAPLAALLAGLSGSGLVLGGGGTRRGYNALYRWGLGALRRGFERILARVERELQREDESRALPSRGEPGAGLPG